MESPFKPNELVWAKINGYPWWPGLVYNTQLIKKIQVVFLGDFSHAFLAPSKIKKIEEISLTQKFSGKKLSRAVRIALEISQGQKDASKELEIFDLAKPTRKSLKSTQAQSQKILPSPQQIVQAINISQDTSLEEKQIQEKIIERKNMQRKFSQFSVLQENNQTQFIERVNEFMEEVDNYLNYLNSLFVLNIELFQQKISEFQTVIISLSGKSLYKSEIGLSLNLFKKKIERIQETTQQRKCFRNYIKFLQDLQDKILKEFLECPSIENLDRFSWQDQLQNSELNSKTFNNNQNFMSKKLTKSQTEELKKAEELTHSSAVKFDLENRVIFRVQRKIGKVIYLNGGKGTLRKQKCDLLAHKIEEFIRKSSKEVRIFVKNFDEHPEKVKKYIVNQSQASNVIPFLKNIEKFIEEQLITFQSYQQLSFYVSQQYIQYQQNLSIVRLINKIIQNFQNHKHLNNQQQSCFSVLKQQKYFLLFYWYLIDIFNAINIFIDFQFEFQYLFLFFNTKQKFLT